MLIVTNNESETYKAGFEWAKKLSGGEVITLNGDLGAGKTVFTKGLGKGLGVTDTVTSPTFTIGLEYQGDSLRLYHFDCYRISGGKEAAETGIIDCMRDTKGVTVIEWADNISDILPTDRININIKYVSENKREIVINDK